MLKGRGCRTIEPKHLAVSEEPYHELLGAVFGADHELAILEVRVVGLLLRLGGERGVLSDGDLRRASQLDIAAATRTTGRLADREHIRKKKSKVESPSRFPLSKEQENRKEKKKKRKKKKEEEKKKNHRPSRLERTLAGKSACGRGGGGGGPPPTTCSCIIYFFYFFYFL